MLRISKLTDYGTVVLAQLAKNPESLSSAGDVATATGIALPTVSKLLKALTRAELVNSTRGAHGGYSLAHAPEAITAASVIDALEGPVSITECSSADSHCDYESFCNIGGAWQRINLAIRMALDDITLADLLKSGQLKPNISFGGTAITVTTESSK